MSLDISLCMNKCPHCGRADEVFSANITQNLNKMAYGAGIYAILWRPEYNGIEKAEQLIEPLRKAIAEMKANPARFKKHNSHNGWGLYEHFLPWLARLLEACVLYPEASVDASR